MKKYVFVIFVLFMSCQDIFQDIDNPYLKIDTYQEKIDMLNGIYNRLIAIHDENYFAVLSRSDDIDNYTNINIFENGSYTIRYSGPIDYPEITGNIYMNLYTAIINVNRLLSVVSVSEESALAGELYFLRSYAYFKLARFFGTPPIILDTKVNYQVKKPTYEELYSQIEEDMLNAIDLLPIDYANSRIPGESPHKGTAKAMLAEIYLSMAGYPLYNESKYAESARLAKEVIDKSDIYNFRLVDDFADLWREENSHTTEYVFGLFFSKSGENSNSLIRVYGEADHNLNTVNLISSSFYHPDFNFYIKYPYNYRKYNSFLTGYYIDLNYESIDTLVNSLYFKLFDPFNEPNEYVTSAGCIKWIYGMYDFHHDGTLMEKSASTIYLLRYAQVLLTYAEAKARSGGADELAYDVLNKIRRRANNVDLFTPSAFDLPSNLSTTQFIDTVVQERAWELAMEPDGRWFDIIRLNLKDEVEANYRFNDQHTVVPEEYLTNDWYFYKIPQEDRWSNPGLEYK